ncbi:MAG: CHASE2 domain-containing protein [Gammaproteobacteria bacterium]
MPLRLRRVLPVLIINAVILLVFLLHVTAGSQSSLRLDFIDRMENLTYDMRVMLSTTDAVDDRIVIVDIDERSLAELGRWPWSRDKLALMVDRLFAEYDISLLGFDVVFAEPDESSGYKIMQQLAEDAFADVPAFSERLLALRDELDYDQRFADSLANRDIVLGYYFRLTESEEPSTGQLPAPVLTARDFRPGSEPAVSANGYGANLAIFQNQVGQGGHFNPEVDDDGVVRRVPMLYRYQDEYYEALSLAMARQYLGITELEPVYAEPGLFGYRGYSGLEWLRMGPVRLPVDAQMRALVPYRGRQNSFPYISATDVIHGRVPVEQLQGRIILVGTSAPGLFDLRTTPVESKFPGVEIHANLVAGILDRNIRARPAYTLGAEFIHVLVAGLIMLGLPLLSPIIGSVIVIGLVSASIAINLLAWFSANLVLPLASVLLLILAIFLVNMTYGFFVEQRGKRQLGSLFGQYVPPELVDEMSENPQAYSLAAENREMSVLFSDVRGFTSISESMQPQELSDLMNELLTPMTRIIHTHRGTIDKYMGDAIMAFWGAPLRDTDHARHAVVTGLEMIRRLNELQPGFQQRGWPEIRIGVGINTGDMSVGNMGSEFRRAYTVLGDAVNLGARLEGLTKTYGVSILVSEFSRAAVPDFTFREIDRVRVKGRDEPVVIYEPLGPTAELDSTVKSDLKLYAEALRQYRAQEWDLAELQFLNLLKATNLKIYAIYVKRIQHFREQPPGADWDGVFTHTTK